MIIQTLRCPVRNRRVSTGDCYERHLLGNCKLAATPEAARRCHRCPVGTRNRARYAAEGDRIGWSERGWPQELREAASKNLLTKASEVKHA